MIPIDSPHLQILPKHATALERRQFLINISTSRVKNYPLRLTPNGLKSPVKLAKDSYYVTKLPLGTGKGLLSPYMVIDTGSDETWVQCEGCDHCFESKYKNFNYKLSPTFSRMGVDDPLCYLRLAYDGSCGLDIKYMDSQSTVGFVGRDVTYLQDTITGKRVPFNGFAFGCGLQNEGFDFSTNMRENIIVGIHGLGVGPRSFLSQFRNEIKGRFSYCLAAGSKLSNMYFGDEAQISGDATRDVKTIAMNNLNRYHVYLNGVSVDGVRISIDPSIFEFDPIGYTKGFIIDSGALHTVLARSAFNPIKDAVVKYFREKYGWEPNPQLHLETYDLCYSSYPYDVQKFPSMSFHFAGIGQQGEVDWVMDNNNLFKKVDEGFCMTILSIDDPGPCLLGAHQQINFNILFEVANGFLSFVPQMCHES
ncbi:aspartic proteinase nepenthesin-1-like [Silene latifolia]|uniref:aspartic proteinase nepenthesin-1-like n=1 Tax=Silene latifolia TaxID=37657 RepID=UPI003D781A0B